MFGGSIQYPYRAYVESKDLVFLGQPDGETIIGPNSHYVDNEWHQGIGVHGVCNIVIRDIKFENLFSAISNFDGCAFVIDNCQFINLDQTIMVMGGETQVQNCFFSTNIEDSIQVFSIGQDHLEIKSCSFNWNEDWPQVSNKFVVIQGTNEVVISDSEFLGAATAFSTHFNPNVTVLNSSFTGNLVNCYGCSGSLNFSGCFFTEQNMVIQNQYEGMLLKMDDCVIQETSIVPFSITYIVEGSYVHNSIFEKGERGVVLYHPHIYEEGSIAKAEKRPTTFDMTKNFWGTTEPDSIQAWIDDNEDDPVVRYMVLWDPYLGQPVETEKRTLQGVKSFFR